MTKGGASTKTNSAAAPMRAARWRRIAGRLEYLKRRREDSGCPVRLVREIRQICRDPSGRRSSMSEDRFEQEEAQDDDVEAHRRKHLNTEPGDELGSDSDDV